MIRRFYESGAGSPVRVRHSQFLKTRAASGPRAFAHSIERGSEPLSGVHLGKEQQSLCFQ